MRTQSLLALLALTACGGDGSSTPDASRPIDAAPGGDATDAPGPTDGSVDGPVTPTDGPVIPAGASRVWAVGDLFVNNSSVVGGFLDSATTPPTFPYGNATATPVAIPGGTAKILGENAFDATATKTAFLADLAVAGRFDLYVAGPAGENPVMLVQGATAVDLTAVALSPDGTKVAYTMDSAAIDGGYDLYVVNTTGTPVSTRVSPDRAAEPTPADLDVSAGFTWSSNSTYLAFMADLTDNAYNQVYVVDTSATTPAAVELLSRAAITATTGARGFSGALAFDAGNKVYFRARLTEGGQFELFSATTTGTRTAFALPARGDASAPDASAFAITPDGAKIVFQADSPTLGTYNLFAQTLGQVTTTNLTNLAAVGQIPHTSTIAFSPDATKIAVVATYALAERRNPYVINLDGSGFHRLAQIPANLVSSDFESVAWTVDGTRIYAVADFEANNDGHAYTLDPAMTDQAPTLAVTSPVSGDVFRVLVRAAQ